MISKKPHHFHTNDGQLIGTLGELFEFITKTDNGTFYHHFNRRENDFANWVGKSLGKKELSDKLYAAKTRGEVHDIIQEELEKPFKAEEKSLEEDT